MSTLEDTVLNTNRPYTHKCCLFAFNEGGVEREREGEREREREGEGERERRRERQRERERERYREGERGIGK